LIVDSRHSKWRSHQASKNGAKRSHDNGQQSSEPANNGKYGEISAAGTILFQARDRQSADSRQTTFMRMDSMMRLNIKRQLIAAIISTGAAVAVGGLGGCESAQKAGTLQQAIDDYNAQRFVQARDRAKSISDSAKPPAREDAAYIAGLSSFQLGDASEAERQFATASTSSNPQTAARSKAMLGQVRLEQRRPKEAATLLADAYTSLDGPDSRKAALNASIAYQQSGDAASSKKWLDIANGVPTAVPLTPSVSVEPSGGVGFTLQVGAFKDKERAKRAADEADVLAKREGLGNVRILLRRDERGMPSYLVQFGSFPTRDAAALARTKLGRLEYIVAATGGSGM
jgi:septal ring-binding cell division protein DamX